MSRYTDGEIEIPTPLTLFMKKRVEMDSHGGLEVTIRQTESKKNYPTTS